MGKIFYSHFDSTSEHSHPVIREQVWSPTAAVLMSKGSQLKYRAPPCFRCSLCVWVHVCWSGFLLAEQSVPHAFILECVLIGELPSSSREVLTERNHNYTYTPGHDCPCTAVAVSPQIQPSKPFSANLLPDFDVINSSTDNKWCKAFRLGSATAGIQASRQTEG